LVTSDGQYKPIVPQGHETDMRLLVSSHMTIFTCL
jgi:hypothetical protein